MRRRKQHYDFDSINYSKKIFNAISKSCLTSTKTIAILIKNSNIFNPTLYSISELNGYAKFEFSEKIPNISFQSLFESFGK